VDCYILLQSSHYRQAETCEFDLALYDFHISKIEASLLSTAISTDIRAFSLHRNTVQGKFYLRNQPIGMCDLRRLRPWMWRLVSSGLSCRTCTDISEQPGDGSDDGSICARVYGVTFQETVIFSNKWMEPPVTESSISRYVVEVRAEHITDTRQQTCDTF
jgi:hypothetical protein